MGEDQNLANSLKNILEPTFSKVKDISEEITEHEICVTYLQYKTGYNGQKKSENNIIYPWRNGQKEEERDRKRNRERERQRVRGR